MSTQTGAKRRQLHNECACFVGFALLNDSSVDEFRRGSNRTSFSTFRTDIDVIRSEDLMESVLMEKSEG